MRFLDCLAGKKGTRHSTVVAVESLESKALMATTSTAAIATEFIAPDLTPYIHLAVVGHVNTGPAVIRTMETALQSQLTNGVLTALQGATLTPTDYQTSVLNVVTSYETNVDTQLLPRFKNIDAILKGQAQSALAVTNALNLQLNDGLINTDEYTLEAAQGINAITGGPLFPLNTPPSGFAAATTELETQLKLLPPTLATGATPSLTLAKAQQIATADAVAYLIPTQTALFTQPKFSQQVHNAVFTFVASVNAITSTDPTTQAQQVTTAITALDAALLDTTGLFGPHGAYRKAH